MTTPAKRSAKKTASEPAVLEYTPDRPEPLIRMKRVRKPDDIPPEQVLLFIKEYDDGTEQEFWVPKRRMASLALKYMHLVRTEDEDRAMAWLMEKVLGAAAYADLMEDDQLEDSELIQIFRLVQSAVMGAVEDPKVVRR